MKEDIVSKFIYKAIRYIVCTNFSIYIRLPWGLERKLSH